MPAIKPKRKRIYIPTGNPRGRPPKTLPVRPAAPPTPILPSAAIALRIEQAAAAMGVSVSFMKRKVGSGEVASFKWGRMRLIPIEGLRALMARAAQPD
jgi:excisionase family DNA binding protein